MKTIPDVADFHAHILPGVDHGSHSLETSLGQLALASKFGVARIIATSHFYPHMHKLDSFLDLRNAAAKELINSKLDSAPQIKLGAEVLLCQGLENFPEIERLCFNGTNYLLLELPFLDFKDEYCYTVEELLNSGIDIILAHADRYPAKNINALIDIGVNKLQLIASSIATLMKKKHLYEWIDSGYIVALGSDIHGNDYSAYKKFSNAEHKLSHRLPAIKQKSDEIWNKII